MTLLHQQIEAKEHLLPYKVGALFMVPGTGKTRVAIELVRDVPSVDLVVWIGPLNTIRTKEGIPSVKDEINKWGGFHCESIFIGIETIQSSDRQYLALRQRIEASQCPFLVIDESLKIKNADTKRTKRAIDLSHLVEYKIILNGTPISRNVLDLWSQMEFLSPKILNMNSAEFKNTFCEYTTITKRFGNGYRYQREFITGYENIDYLYSLIRHYVFECDLELNVLQKYKSISYSVGEDEKEEYYRLKDYFLSDDELMWKNNNIFLEMTQKMQHAYCCTESKFALLEELFTTIPENKTIIFCKYVISREECQRRFPRATVLSYQKESMGLNLQHLNHTVYFDKVWDYALRIQSSRRTFRTGQECDCWYYDLTGDVGLEHLIDSNIDKKIGMIEYFKSKTKEQLEKEL